MDISVLLNFLQDNPDTLIPSPWKQIFDVETGLVYYKHSENGFLIYDFRPLVNIRRGIFLDNSLNSASIDCADTRQMITNFQNSYGLSKVYLFRITCCADITIHCIVDQPVFKCMLCHCIVGKLP
ncbi:unnamed protein product [Lathyrus oleraceus]|uniref:Uncharacterized protein n=1 Tax=Pisum sativum TaxID=3888 RepID=A0A9D4Y254_PEA|nr:uncharacterized protein LOC127128174 [Pisum sativum]KAI5431219.1 hypothetical protein KIW84_035399 [Pisum sativum]